MIEQLCERFKPDESQADLGILYEVTGYKSEADDSKFWEDFEDTDEIKAIQNLINSAQ